MSLRGRSILPKSLRLPQNGEYTKILRGSLVQGRVVATKGYLDQQYLELGIEQAAGLYFVQVYTNKKEAVFKVLKK